MRGRQMAVVILDQMQMLDQQIALPRTGPKQATHVRERPRVDLPALGGAPRPPATASRLANSATV